MKYLLAVLIALVWLSWAVVYMAYAESPIPQGYEMSEQGVCGFPDGSRLPCAKFEKNEDGIYCYCREEYYIMVLDFSGQVLGVVRFKDGEETLVWPKEET